MPARVRGKVLNHVIRVTRRDSSGDTVQVKQVAYLPSDDMISAGGIATDAEAADKPSSGIVERQATTKDVHAADLPADHVIIRPAVVARVAGVCGIGVNGVACL
jgi:hypothetical protein